jgi:hypothetical protein
VHQSRVVLCGYLSRFDLSEGTQKMQRMFQVVRFDQFPSQGIEVGLFTTREEATSAAQMLVTAFQHHGYDGKQDYWWGRNEGDAAIRFLVQAK